MSQYLNEKEFEGAYKIACLGVTEADWRALALDALEGLNLNIAKNCFVRIRDLRYLELIHTLLEKKKRNEYESDSTYLADIYAFQVCLQLCHTGNGLDAKKERRTRRNEILCLPSG